MKKALLDLQPDSYCCCQTIMAMGLKKMGKRNKDLIEVVSGICGGGLFMEETYCGALIGANCLILLHSKEQRRQRTEEMNLWFKEAFTHFECKKLSGYDYMAKTEQCPLIVEQTYKKLCELLDWN